MECCSVSGLGSSSRQGSLVAGKHECMYVQKGKLYKLKRGTSVLHIFCKNHFSYHFWDDAGGELLNSFKINEQNWEIDIILKNAAIQ